MFNCRLGLGPLVVRVPGFSRPLSRRFYEGFLEGVLQWVLEGGRVLRRVLGRGSKKGLSRGRRKPFWSTTPFKGSKKTPKIPPKMFVGVPFLRSFPGNEAHELFSGGPKWGQKVYVEKVYVLFPSPINGGFSPVGTLWRVRIPTSPKRKAVQYTSAAHWAPTQSPSRLRFLFDGAYTVVLAINALLKQGSRDREGIQRKTEWVSGRERERERDRERERERRAHTHTHIYIYIYIERERETGRYKESTDSDRDRQADKQRQRQTQRGGRTEANKKRQTETKGSRSSCQVQFFRNQPRNRALNFPSGMSSALPLSGVVEEGLTASPRENILTYVALGVYAKFGSCTLLLESCEQLADHAESDHGLENAWQCWISSEEAPSVLENDRLEHIWKCLILSDDVKQAQETRSEKLDQLFAGVSRGNTIRGNRTERFWEGNLPLWEDLWEGGLQRFSEVFRGFQRFSEVFRGF